jgi:uncharacterized membrane protein YfcA
LSPLVLPIGLLIGLSLGALGGGGSILTVPALVYLLGQDPRHATTNSLLIVGLTSLTALVPHARRGHVRVGQGLAFGALGTAGSLAGSALSARVPAAVLLSGFAVLLAVVAVLMLRRSRAARPGEAGPGGAGAAHASTGPVLALRPWRCSCPRAAKVVVTATAVGLLTGFFGVGGGFVLVPALVLALSFPMTVAVGTSLLVIAVNSATALAARMSSGASGLHWGLVVTVTVAAVAGSLAGGRLAARLEPRHLTRAFGVLLLAVAVYTAARSVPTLS